MRKLICALLLASSPLFAELPVRSDLDKMLEIVTPVRNQQGKSTCAVFASTAYMESMLIREGHFNREELDLSEEWVYFMFGAKFRPNDMSAGTDPVANLNLMRRYGIPTEETLEYDTEKWDSVHTNNDAYIHCGSLDPKHQKLCLDLKRNPDLLRMKDEELNRENPLFKAIRKDARDFKQAYIEKVYGPYRNAGLTSGQNNIKELSEMKRMINDQHPLILSAEVHYNAWNHPLAYNVGINMSVDHYYNGVVTYPAKDDRDFEAADANTGAHAVLIVGYDDERVVTNEYVDLDGNTQVAEYKGVFYFKNSWGTDGYGRNFRANGKAYPGYGMIPYKNVLEYGKIYFLNKESLKRKKGGLFF